MYNRQLLHAQSDDPDGSSRRVSASHLKGKGRAATPDPEPQPSHCESGPSWFGAADSAQGEDEERPLLIRIRTDRSKEIFASAPPPSFRQAPLLHGSSSGPSRPSASTATVISEAPRPYQQQMSYGTIAETSSSTASAPQSSASASKYGLGTASSKQTHRDTQQECRCEGCRTGGGCRRAHESSFSKTLRSLTVSIAACLQSTPETSAFDNDEGGENGSNDEDVGDNWSVVANVCKHMGAM
ncbi:hypothetical protein I316_06031 [Kwoniella heveanensis BCC8398]|uniref:Uncharacterized protein n=1 Tax=Kwoniella heveanensis BCC8398 TaxID=1296120 RepID=A0A1B9GMT9_9TREE|nr:hypothetical protein I316_06031 [Kwoniella heveanensis BCC8398]